MSKQSGDPSVMPSSIALLQERFRQLQRAKEMREEKELLRLFSNSEPANPTTFHEPSRLPFTSELILPPRPPLQTSLSQPPNSQSKHADLQVIETPVWANNLRSRDRVPHRSDNPDDSDVDTSLHL
ncbi:uncharacterized protein LOC131149906 [Malania oleifera]|uniref:uncharacterized protein LOC131149906 n=1 Tax=Malania oleifera TaxID=397392 RepID=UPI0025ADFB30|nr:uncharacterized protein LOC131149906 [Malania oleifera]